MDLSYTANMICVSIYTQSLYKLYSLNWGMKSAKNVVQQTGNLVCVVYVIIKSMHFECAPRIILALPGMVSVGGVILKL